MEVNIQRPIDLNDLKSETETMGRFTKEAYNNLPCILKNGTDLLSGNDRDVFLFGAMIGLSSALPNITALYDNQLIESNLYGFMYGDYGCGKGALIYSKQIVAPIHKYLRLTETPQEPNSDVKPDKKLHFLPANNSKSGFIELLASNGRGLIFEPEADTLSDILRQEFAGFSDVLRKAYHHETINFYRRLNKEYYDIERPKLSVLLSGTPDQLCKLIPSIENGLFSRFCFYQLFPEPDFKNVFCKKNGNLSNHFYQIGDRILSIYKTLLHSTEPIFFEFQTHQERDFIQYFQALKQSLINNYGPAIIGEVHRFGIQFFRIAMILTSLRIEENGHIRANNKIICTDLDYKTAKQIFEVYRWHALTLFENLTTYSQDNLPENKRKFYEALPVNFQTNVAVKTGLQFDISEPTIKRFIKNNKLFECTKHGHYKKRHE